MFYVKHFPFNFAKLYKLVDAHTKCACFFLMLTSALILLTCSAIVSSNTMYLKIKSCDIKHDTIMMKEKMLNNPLLFVVYKVLICTYNLSIFICYQFHIHRNLFFLGHVVVVHTMSVYCLTHCCLAFVYIFRKEICP